MGISKDLLLEPPILDLICSICKDVIDGPIQVQCPEDHIYCHDCIHDFLKKGNIDCPVCKVELDVNAFQVSKFVARQIGRLKIRCANHSTGCNYHGPISENHSATCSFQLEACPHQKHGCMEVLARKNLTLHVRSCEYELLPCPNNPKKCKPFLRQNKKHHDSTCKYFRCDYSEEGCHFIGTMIECRKHCDSYCGKLHARIAELESQVTALTKKVETIDISPESETGKKIVHERQNSMHDNHPTNQGWKRPRLANADLIDGEDMLEQLLQSDDYGFSVADDEHDESRTPGYPFSEDELMSLSNIYSDQNLNEDSHPSLISDIASTPHRDVSSPVSPHPNSPPVSRSREPKRKVQRYNKVARAARNQKTPQTQNAEEKAANNNDQTMAASTPGSERRGSTHSPPANFMSPPSSGSMPSRKQRPMFVLASSYLNKHNSGSSTTSSPEMSHQSKSAQPLPWGQTPPEEPKVIGSFTSAMNEVERIATDS